MIARWHGEPFRDFKSKKWYITFEVDEQPTLFDSLREKVLSLDIKEYRKKRSLDANSYCWVLCTKMASILNTSKDEVYEEMIQRYGTLDTDGEGYIIITLLEKIPVERLGGHWKFVKHEGRFCSYIKLKGSSEMDSKEMAVLLDGIVTECKEMGIETATPNELERMKEQWGIKTNISQ